MPRPTRYTKKLADKICVRLAEGDSLREICRDESMPSKSTVLLWVVTPGHEFSDQYVLAREAAGYSHADRQVDLANMCAEEGIDPQSARVAMQGYQWAAERMAPKKHSPRQELDHSSSDRSMSPPQAIMTTDPVEAAKEYQRIMGGDD